MTSQDKAFRRTVLSYYRRSGRHDLPWRQTHDPYRILVSELMLQQTQVPRVIPKYEAFVAQWSTPAALAKAPLGDVLRAWQGLGYNRRARFLHEAARAVVSEHDGEFPAEYEVLRALPGIGPYTAAAVLAFAFDESVQLIETNVRRCVLHHYFPDREAVDDREVMAVVERLLPRRGAREWYAALMDYGTELKRVHGNANVRSRQYKKQSRFAGSDRQIRGAVLRFLSERDRPVRVSTMLRALSAFDVSRVEPQLRSLVDEGLVRYERGMYHLG